MATYYRRDWAAQPPKQTLAPIKNVPYGVVHHIGGGNAYPTNVVATLQQIQSSEQHGDYLDIAYNWGVDKDGNLWELRGDVQDGATKGYAGNSFSVLAICNASASDFKPTSALIAGIAACFRNAQSRGVLSRSPNIDGHTVFDRTQTSSPTVCPGELEQQIRQIRTLVATVAPAPAPQEIPKNSPEGQTMILVGTRDWLGRYHGHQVSGGAPVYGFGVWRQVFAQGAITRLPSHSLFVRAVDKNKIVP